jgi:hypothetical protein
MTWQLWSGLALGAPAVVWVGLSILGSRRWSGRVNVLTGRLESARVAAGEPPARATHYDPKELAGLPAPVQRYFRAVLTEGQRIIEAATIDLAGTINLSASGEQWKPFKSTQRVVTRRPGFLWDAKVTMLPGLAARVVDSYIAGHGLLHAALLGLFTVAHVRGGGEIARGELMRYFAEAAWYPTALLPSQGVVWAAVDERSANATLVDGPLALTLLFRFDDAGLIDSVRAESRGGMVGHDLIQMPWECSVSTFEVRSGMTVPTMGEAAWVRAGVRKPYFIGRLTSVSYEFAE